MKTKQKRCKNCRQPFTPIRSTLEKYCTNSSCVRVWVATEKEKQWKKTKAVKKAELMTTKDYYQLALAMFNKYIRLRDKDKPCVSCGAKAGTYRITSGHYFPQGQNKSIALDERNAHGQCWFNCNSSKSGNLSEYYPELIRRIGIDNYNELVMLKNESKHFTIDELKEITSVYKEKKNNLKKD